MDRSSVNRSSNRRRTLSYTCVRMFAINSLYMRDLRDLDGFDSFVDAVLLGRVSVLVDGVVVSPRGSAVPDCGSAS